MATGATAQFWVRTDGAATNGGGYDFGISGAGTNYCNQASAQASWTSSLSLSSGTITDTGASGLFTSAMVGNLIQVASQGYYWISAFTNSNTVSVVNATGTTATSFSAASGKIGGAFAGLVNLAAGGGAGLAGPTLSSPLGAGNPINLRSQFNVDNPATSQIDWDYSAGYYTWASGDTTGGRIRFVGYNGRPNIKTSGLLFYTGGSTQNFEINGLGFVAAAGGGFLNFSITGQSSTNQNQDQTSVINCHYDANGQDVFGFGGSGLISGNKLFNTGGGATGGTYPALQTDEYDSDINGNYVNGWRGPGLVLNGDGGGSVSRNVIANCGGDGVVFLSGAGSRIGYTLEFNTIDGNTGHGINLKTGASLLQTSIRNNILANHVGTGKAAINVTDNAAALNGRINGSRVDYNDVYNNSTAGYINLPSGAHDITANPTYANTSSGDYTPTNSALAAACPPAIGGATNNLYIGAVQPAGSGGGSTVIVVDDD